MHAFFTLDLTHVAEVANLFALLDLARDSACPRLVRKGYLGTEGLLAVRDSVSKKDGICSCFIRCMVVRLSGEK